MRPHLANYTAAALGHKSRSKALVNSRVYRQQGAVAYLMYQISKYKRLARSYHLYIFKQNFQGL